MIDGIGRGQPPRLAVVTTDVAARAGVAPEAATAAHKPAAPTRFGFVREMAASPPVDAAKVERLKLAIASGAYRPDPEAIAARMLALESGSGGK